MKDDKMKSGCTGAIPVCAMAPEAEEKRMTAENRRIANSGQERQEPRKSLLSSDIYSFL
jgi:hypothetical protein